MAVLGAHVTAKTSTTVAVCGPSATQTSTGGAGTIFWLAVGWANGNATAPVITDSKGNTYTIVGAVISTAGGTLHSALFRCEAGTGGTLHTWTATFLTAPDAISFFLQEGTGCVSSGITDAAPAGFDDAASPYVSNLTGTTAQANELLFAWIFTLSSSGTEVLTHGNSFTAIDTQANATTDITGASSQRTVAAISSYQSSVTSAGAGTTEAISFIVSLKDASGGAAVQVWARRNNVLLESPLFEEPIQRRRIPVTLFARLADQPPLVQYDTSDLDPGIYDDLRPRRPWAPVGSTPASAAPNLDRNPVGFDEPAFEERLARRAWYPGSTDRPIFTPRRSIEERACDDLQQRRPWYPGSTDAAPLTRARGIFDEPSTQDNTTRKPWAPPGVTAVVSTAPNAPRRTVADESYPDGIQRKQWIPVSGPIPANAPLRVLRAVSDDSAPDLITRRPWIPVSGPVITPDQAPRQRARVLADDALPDERQRRPWLPVSGPAPQQQALARPRGVLDEAIEERLQRRPWAPPSSDAPIWRAGRMPDEPKPDERLSRRQWAPVGVTPDAPPRVSRARVADELAPDWIQRRPWAPPSGPPVVRDNPPLRVVRMVADEIYPDVPQRRPWIPVSGPVIPQFGGSVRVYYRSQSVRVRIIE